VHLIQILLPLSDNDGRRFSEEPFIAVRRELTERFGGVTAYARAPATGMWKRDEGDVARDDNVMVEVMVDELDREWWRAYRDRLAALFRQEELVVRALPIERL
jgi:hypothetical protein